MEILRDIAHDATLKATIFVNKKMPRLMLYLYQYELLAHKIYREITLEATSFSSSCMSQLLQLFNWRQGFSREMALKATAFADSCMSQLLLVLFPYESDLLLFGVLNCVLQPAFFLYIFLPQFEDEYHLFPNEVDNFGDEQFLGIAHIVMSVGFGGTAYIATSTCFSIVEFGIHFWSKLLGYSLVIVAGVAPLFSSIGYLLFVHDGRYETDTHPLVKVVEDKSLDIMRLAVSQLMKYGKRTLTGLLSYMKDSAFVVLMALTLAGFTAFVGLVGDWIVDDRPLHPMVTSVEDWTLEFVRGFFPLLVRSYFRFFWYRQTTGYYGL
jgi:hypothetical protein